MRMRFLVGILTAASLVAHTQRLESVRWWRSPTVAESLGLTSEQARVIEEIERHRRSEQRECTERFVAASDQMDQFMDNEIYTVQTLRQTEELIKAGADESALTRELNAQVLALLSPDQRRTLEHLGSLAAR
jgi:LTXXQ motif family protein